MINRNIFHGSVIRNSLPRNRDECEWKNKAKICLAGEASHLSILIPT